MSDKDPIIHVCGNSPGSYAHFVEMQERIAELGIQVEALKQALNTYHDIYSSGTTYIPDQGLAQLTHLQNEAALKHGKLLVERFEALKERDEARAEVARAHAEIKQLHAVVDAAMNLSRQVRELDQDAKNGLIEGHTTPISAVIRFEDELTKLDVSID